MNNRSGVKAFLYIALDCHNTETTMRHKKLLRFSVIISVVLLTFSCNDDKEDKTDPKDIPTDYSVADNWLYVSSDAVMPVDVFFVYPTTYSGNDTYGAVTDPNMRAGAMRLRNQMATVYEESANLYMPYYRQTNGSKALNLSDAEQDALMRSIPVADIIAAFEYYLDNYSNGRPFILAGHSQGSNTLLYVLEQMTDKPELLDRLVCAYIIGYSVTSSFLYANPPLAFATGSTDTGVIVSWNTESPGVTDSNPVIKPGALAINPIIWTTDETYASEELSLGARLEVLPGVLEKVERFADAQVNNSRGSIICSTADPTEFSVPVPIFPFGVLHGSDYKLYYYDLLQNVADRVDAYFQAQQ